VAPFLPLVWVTLFAALAAACAADTDRSPAAPVTNDRELDGPLSVGDVRGGQSFLAPRSRPERWSASQGSFALCTTGPPVVIEEVRASARQGAALTVGAWVVSDVPASGEFGTFGSTLGSPPRFDQAYVDGPALRGTYRPAAGTEVAESCPAPSLRDGGEELVLTVETDRRGVDVPQFEIRYSSGDEAYSLPVEWAMVLCGTEARRRCDGL